MEYNELKAQIQKELAVDKDIADNDDLIALGLSSLAIMKLMNNWRKKGIKLSFGKLMDKPFLGEWHKLITKSSSKKTLNKKTAEADMKQEFPLTDVQYAYWTGRADGQVLGNIGCHAYLEFSGENVSAERLEKAWNALQYHHPMLRACFTEKGMQKINDAPYSEKIRINDFSDIADDMTEKAVGSVRERLSHRKLNVEKGEVAGLELTLLPDNKTVIHIDVDLLIADVQSLQIILRDLVSAYNGRELPANSANWNFASYLLNCAENDRDDMKKAEKYWKERLDTLPKGPVIPMKKRPEEVERTVFSRRKIRIESSEWEKLKERASQHKTTTAVLLLSAYSAILERWSENKRFSVNIPMFNRKSELKGIEDAIADFTTLLLLEVNCENAPMFSELVSSVSSQLHKDMEYSAYSGVKVQRELAKLYGSSSAWAPVVFACNLDTRIVNDEFRENLGEFTYMISQTPQVWIDFQSYEDENGILLTWDCVDELFPDGMIDDMMSSFEMLLHRLAVESWEQRFDVLPESQKRYIESSFISDELEKPQCIHTAFLENAEKAPDKTALYDSGEDIAVTYGEVKERAYSIAGYLAEKQICKNAVGLVMPRRSSKIIAALGIIMSGNAYISISSSQPAERRSAICRKTGVKYIITDRKTYSELQWSDDIEVFVFEDIRPVSDEISYPVVSPDDIAYIITTSGSTGEPKGVEIAHKSAWNTIEDVNGRYGISSADTAIAVSDMDFDLSVYDVFGILGIGGTLVLLSEEDKRNPDRWIEYIEKYDITVWNSVPILFDMLLIRAEALGKKLPLKTVMLSGDWIGMDLPERAAKLTDNCSFISMGGATEASIWSNYQVVTLPMPSEWKTIPYGRPLKNQSYRVADAQGRDVPFWAVGELWIGGCGLARGYRNDPEMTEKKFIYDEHGRWYRTGDLGRIWSDGTIEFLGRKDHQVKIRGHRIELGEIEHAISCFNDINNASADVFTDGHGNKSLAAFIGAELKEESMVTVPYTKEDRFSSNINEISATFGKDVFSVAQKAEYRKFMEYADEKCAFFIYHTLEKMGAFAGNDMTRSNIPDKCGADDSQRETLLKWVDMLVKRGILSENGDIISVAELPKDISAEYSSIDSYFAKLGEYVTDIITGKTDPLEVFYQLSPELSPSNLLKIFPLYDETINSIISCIEKIASGCSGKIKVLELNTRDTAITEKILEKLKNNEVEYTYSDLSHYFTGIAKKELAGYENVSYQLLDIDSDITQQGTDIHEYDIIISVGAMHRVHDLDKAMENVSKLLAPNGVFIMSDITAETSLQNVSAALLEKGFSDITDERKLSGKLLPDTELWRKMIGKSGLSRSFAVKEYPAFALIISQQQEKVAVYDESRLKEYLSGKLPEYMIPKKYCFMEQLPMLSNGKLNRKVLKQLVNENNTRIKNEILSDTEKALIDIWKDIFGFDNISAEDNYFNLGGDSLIATKLISQIQKKFGCKLSIAAVFENLTVRLLAKAVENAEKTYDDSIAVEADTEHRFEAFPLTDVQYAYWIGRSGLYQLGNVSTHCYFELDSDDIDMIRAENAWNKLISRHGMMRVIIQPDGRQRILENVPEYHIGVEDMSALDEDEKKKALETQREIMSHQVIDTENWPLFDVRASKLSDKSYRLHISFDNLIFDGWSMFHLLSEWSDVYNSGKLESSIAFSFRDYVLGLENIKKSEVYNADKQYWESRIADLSPAPSFPMKKTEDKIDDQKFCRRSEVLSEKEWSSLKELAKKIGVTPSVFLISAYSETLRRWSMNKNFTLNLTQFDRKPLNPEVNSLIGDFTTLTLLEILDGSGKSFAERARAVQKQLTLDLEHSSYSAVEAEREIRKHTGNMYGSVMPVVFTSGLGIEQWNDGKWLGKVTYNVSQTPQVWLDHQVVEMNGGLCLSWDSLDELFCDGVLDEMFSAYISLLRGLAEEHSIAEKEQASAVVYKLSEARINANMTASEYPDVTLDELFIEAALSHPEKEALVTAKRRMTYSELLREAVYISEELKAKGFEQGMRAAVFAEKGWEQIAAVYGILFAGGVYIPIDIHNPQERIEKILNDSMAKAVLVSERALTEEPWIEKYSCIKVCGKKADISTKTVKNQPDAPAYVIYTSGTTGMPKGAVISHHGAVNTILDINKRYEINENDTAIGISNLHFDLSVYDIFGILGCGGKLVIPDPDRAKEPSHWLELIENEKITIWNSVPAFMEMLAEYEEHHHSVNSGTLRAVLMSGDWIPVDLPERIRAIFRDCRLISLGGATEASIWSNIFEIPENIPENWISIPYGKPLANQRYYVLDNNMNDCPDWAAGTLYIAGEGLAQCYLNDKEKTDEKFVFSEKHGQRMYCTGDMGRYWNDGNIEFLGRIDDQVKVNGYRVELGEIKNALGKVEGIKDAEVIKTANGDITAFVVPEPINENDIVKLDTESLIDTAKKKFADRLEDISENASEYEDILDRICISVMAETFIKLGIVAENKYTYEELLATLDVRDEFTLLMKNWIEVMKEHSVVKQEGEHYYVSVASCIKHEEIAAEALANLHTDMKNNIDTCIKIIRTKGANIQAIQDHEFILTPDTIEKHDLIQRPVTESFLCTVKQAVLSKSEPVVIEAANRLQKNTGEILAMLDGHGKYIYIDEFADNLADAEKQFAEYDNFEGYEYDIREKGLYQGKYFGVADIVILDNVLHRVPDISMTLNNIKRMMKPDGVVIIREFTENVPLLMCTVAFLEDGYSSITDERKEYGLPLLSEDEWIKTLKKAGADDISVFRPETENIRGAGDRIIVCNISESIAGINSEDIKNELKGYIPEYMIPFAIYAVESIPLSANGKVDKKALGAMITENYAKDDNINTDAENEEFTDTEKIVAQLWSEILGRSITSRNAGFFKCGGDSLKAIKFINSVKEKTGAELKIGVLFNNPSLMSIAAELDSQIAANDEGEGGII